MTDQGRVAVVTGGNGGLGRVISDRLARDGFDIAITFRSARKTAHEVVEHIQEIGRSATAIRCDLEQPAECESLVEQVVSRFERIDLLVNNAACNIDIPFADLESLTVDTWRRIMDTNLLGPFVCSRACGELMKKQGGGHILNIASVAGLAPTGSSIAYSVSKSALIHLTKCMAVALAPNVLVNCIAPGFMEGTRASANLSASRRAQLRKKAILGVATAKDEVADFVRLFARTQTTTGQTVVIDAGGRVFH